MTPIATQQPYQQALILPQVKLKLRDYHKASILHLIYHSEMCALAKRQLSYLLVVVVRMVNTFAIFSTQLLTNLYILGLYQSR